MSFSMAITLSVLLGHAYLYQRLVRDTGASRGVRRGVRAVLVLLSPLMIFRRTLQEHLPPGLAEPLSALLATWMGVGLFLVLALLGLELVRGALALRRRWRARAASPAPPVDEERRQLLSRVLAGGALVSGGGTAAYGSWRAFSPPRVTEVEIKVPRLPKALDGLSIVQLTDLHVGPFLQRRFMDELVRRTNALRPDVVAVTGDLVDGSVPVLGGHVAALANLRSRFGSFFVTGNHDYYSDEREWCAFVQSLGIEVLRNRHVRLGDAGGSLDLVGVDDWSGGQRVGRKGYDLDLALEGRDPGRAAVLLSHQPANFPVAVERGMDVQISGHTHGGQLPPVTFFIGRAWEFSAGLYRHGDSHIFVSRGCGFAGPPMRVGSPPEIVKLVLTA